MFSKKIFLQLLVLVLTLYAAPCFGFISGTVTNVIGQAVTGATVTFTDESNPDRYMSAVTDAIGNYSIDFATSVNEINDITPETFVLSQNYPNPFNPTTLIPFLLSKAGDVKIVLYSVNGQHIRTLIDEYRTAGIHSVGWDARDDNGSRVAAGVYLYRLQADGKSDTKKMLLLDGGAGGSSAGAGTLSSNTLRKSARLADSYWDVAIKGDGIKNFTESHLILSDGNAYDFAVVTLPSITFVSMPGITYQMGDEVGDLVSYSRPVHTVTVSGFEMGAFEITNVQYALFLNQALATGDITASSDSITGASGLYVGHLYIELTGSLDTNNKCWIIYSNGAFSVAPGKENWPVVWVTWYGAKAFAIYYDLDLPTEAEWEYCCRGGNQYLYGSDDGTISSAKANHDNLKSPTNVGYYPKNPFGIYDMSGNVWEWTHDWYEDFATDSQTNPTGARYGSDHTVRGGGYDNLPSHCRSAFRHFVEPDHRGASLGFRVVRRIGSKHY